MLQIMASGIRRAALAAALIAIPVVSAQQSKDTGTAPVPAQIAAAHKVFISNAGADISAQAAFKRAGEPDEAYNHFYFYSAMQDWDATSWCRILPMPTWFSDKVHCPDVCNRQDNVLRASIWIEHRR